MDSQDAAHSLTDYVLGRLDPHRQELVARAVAADPELQTLEAWLRRAHRLLDLAGGAIFGHPDSDHLVTFALEPDAADPETAAHAVACPACRETVAATRGVRDDLAGRVSLWRRLREQFSWRQHGSAFVVGAALAAALMLLVSPLWRAPAPMPGDAGATRTLWVAAATRGAGAVTPAVTAAGVSSVTLLVAAEPLAAPQQTAVQLELRRDGAVAWSWRGPAAEVWNPQLGVMSFVVPAAELAPGSYELILGLDGATAVQRTVRVDG
jgi:hypothetical protein